MKNRVHLTIFHYICSLAVILLMVVMALLLGFLVKHGIANLNLALFFGNTNIVAAIFHGTPVWDGIWPAVVGTFSLVLLSLLLAVVPGIGCGIFLAEYANPKAKSLGVSIIDTLAGTPSIVMGLFGFSLILMLRHTIWPQANTGLLLAAICLAILVLPVLIINTREAFESIPKDIRITAATLGFTKAQCIRHLLLPSASKGIFGGVVLTIGRITEDTAVVMLTGVVANSGLPAGLGSKFEALPFKIYVTAAEYQSELELAQGFSTALILLCIAAVIMLSAKYIEKTYKQRWQRG